jgi:hypothetical protein
VLHTQVKPKTSFTTKGTEEHEEKPPGIHTFVSLVVDEFDHRSSEFHANACHFPESK